MTNINETRIVNWGDQGVSGVKTLKPGEVLRVYAMAFNETVLQPGDVVVCDKEGWDRGPFEDVGYLIFTGENAITEAESFAKNVSRDDCTPVVFSDWGQVPIDIWHY